MKQRIKSVSIYSDWWHPDSLGGAENSARVMAHDLSKLNFEVNVFTIRNSQQRSHEKDGKLLVNRIRVPIFRREANPKLYIKYIERLRLQLDFITPLILAIAISKSKPEIIILHNMDRPGPLLVPFLRKASSTSRIFRVFHDLGDTCHTRSRFKRGKICELTCLLCKPREIMHKKCGRFADENIFVSKFLLERFEELGFDFNNKSVGYPLIPNFQRVTIGMDRNFNDSSIYVGYIGRVSIQKGLLVLLDACNLIAKTCHIKLVIYGHGDKKFFNLLKSYTVEKNFILEFKGSDPNAPLMLKGIVNLVVVPSLWEEPFGKVPLETISITNVPVVISNSGGLPESKLFVNGGITCFESGNVLDLANKIQEISRSQDIQLKIDLVNTLSGRIIHMMKK